MLHKLDGSDSQDVQRLARRSAIHKTKDCEKNNLLNDQSLAPEPYWPMDPAEQRQVRGYGAEKTSHTMFDEDSKSSICGTWNTGGGHSRCALRPVEKFARTLALEWVAVRRNYAVWRQGVNVNLRFLHGQAFIQMY